MIEKSAYVRAPCASSARSSPRCLAPARSVTITRTGSLSVPCASRSASAVSTCASADVLWPFDDPDELDWPDGPDWARGATDEATTNISAMATQREERTPGARCFGRARRGERVLVKVVVCPFESLR